MTNVIAFNDPFGAHRRSVPGMRVLLVDACPTQASMVQRLLEKAGHRVTLVDDPERGLDLLAVGDVDAVVVGVEEASAIDMLRKLRLMQAGSTNRTPTLVLASDDGPATLERFSGIGARRILPRRAPVGRILEALAGMAATVAKPPITLEQRPAEPLAPADVFDPTVLDELSGLGLGSEFTTSFIAQVFAEIYPAINAFDKAVQDGEWHAAHDAMYLVRSAAGNVGLVGLADIARDLIKTGDAHLAIHHGEHMKRLRDAVERGQEILTARQNATCE